VLGDLGAGFAAKSENGRKKPGCPFQFPTNCKTFKALRGLRQDSASIFRAVLSPEQLKNGAGIGFSHIPTFCRKKYRKKFNYWLYSLNKKSTIQ
jgi:hypothetical protein